MRRTKADNGRTTVERVYDCSPDRVPGPHPVLIPPDRGPTPAPRAEVRPDPEFEFGFETADPFLPAFVIGVSVTQKNVIEVFRDPCHRLISEYCTDVIRITC
jgi:hypothetical protein